MFAIHLRQVYRTCDKFIIRNLRNRRLETRKLEPRGNPGIDNRLQAFKDEGLDVKADDLEEFIERSDSDFYNAGESYDAHIEETLIGKHDLRHHIVKEKYFKEQMPNLLTWSEKEQIRHLATTEPDEWTPEKFSESFPVTVPVVKKLLKYAWKPATEQRIERHDASVMRNWKELKDGTFNIPEDLRKHFLKFSNRTIPPLNKKSIKIDLTQEKKMGEFESIVQRCATNENSKHSNNVEGIPKIEDNEDSNNKEQTSKPKVKKDATIVTLEELTSKIKNRLEKGSKVDMDDQIIVDTIRSNKMQATHENITNDVELYNTEENSITEYKEKHKDTKSVMDYPERIRIPKKAYKKGATYKVNDCYYDHDGRFLYRVLGLSN